MKTLLIESDPPVRALLKTTLTDWQFDVADYAQTAAAIAHHQREAFPLIVVGLGLNSAQEGPALCRQIRALPDGRQPVIVIVTGTLNTGDLQALLEAGADDYQPQPLQLPLFKIRMEIATHLALTRQKQIAANFALSESEQALQIFFDYAPIPIVMVLQNRLYRLNHAFQNWLGYTQDELNTFSLLEMIQHLTYSDDLAAETKLADQMIAGQITQYRIEKRFVTKQGQIVWGDAFVKSLPSHRPNQIRGLTMIQDITERKAAEEQVRLNDARFHALFKGVPHPVSIWQRRGHDYIMIDYNEAAVTLTEGYVKNLLGTSFHALNVDQPDLSEWLEECYQNQGTITREFQYQLRATGRNYHFITSYVFVPPDMIALHLVDITQLRLAEERDRYFRKFLRGILDALPEHIAIIDPDGMIVDVNKAWRDFGHQNGYDNSTCGLGLNYQATCQAAADFGFKEAQKIVTNIRDLFNKQNAQFMVEYPCHSTKEKRWFNLRMTRFELDQKVFLVAAHESITEIKLAEEALQQSEQKYRMLFDSANDVILIIDMENDTILDANQRAVTTLGYAYADLRKLRISDIADPIYASQSQQQVKQEIEKYGSVIFEHSHRCKDGRRIPVEVSSRQIEYDGRPAFLSLARDITERRRAAEALRENQRHLQALITSLDDIVFLLNADYVYLQLWTNQPGNFYFPSEQVLGKKIADIFPQPLAKMFENHIDRAIQSGTRQTIEYKTLENPIWFEAMASRLALPDEKTPLISVLVRDITARKRVETELKQAKETADAANQAKSTFLARMSHELRTPLNAILGYAQILGRDQDLSRRQQQAIQTIYSSGEHLLRLINDILDLAKIEANKLELNPQSFQLSHLLNDIVAIMRIQAELKGINLVYQAPAMADLFLLGDDNRIRQILLNLLSNAIKFTPDGYVTFTVETMPESDESFWRIRFQVEDTGSGIPANQLENIFQPFYQLNPQSEQNRGSGLGMAISQQLARQMSSQIHVYSEVGRGSLFWLVLTLPISQHSRSPIKKPTQPIIGYQHLAGAPRKILLVDDNERSRWMLHEILKPLGFEIFEAGGGWEGLQLAQRHQPDLILLDLVMPDLDGFAVLEKLHQIPEQKETLVVIQSANAFEQIRQKCLTAGASGFIAKPIHTETLLDTIQNLLKLEWLYEESKSPKQPEPEVIRKDQLPAAEDLQRIRKMAKGGDFTGLERLIRTLESDNPAYEAFVRQLHRLLNNFEFDKTVTLMDQYLTRTSRNQKEI